MGLNEPGEALKLGSHITKLNEKTKQHTMLEQAKDTEVEYGLTLGIDQLLSSKRLLILGTGEGKEQTYRELLSESVSCKIPATFLQLHNNAVCLMDTSVYDKKERRNR